MEPKVGDIVVVKNDIYIDYHLVLAGKYEVMGYNDTGTISITEDDEEDGYDEVIEDWEGQIVLLYLRKNEDCDYYIYWWVPFRKDICDFYRVPKRDKQLLLCF